jgi:hypothetical protein
MTFANLQERFLYLIGESDTTSITDIHKSHINASIRDICNIYPFSWNLKTADLTLSSGTASLPSDYNPIWHIRDARVTGSSTGDDSVYTEIPIEERDNYDSDAYVYWITQSTTTGTFTFNTPTQTGTVTIYYYVIQADLSADADVCIVPDGEAVAYLAASKNWIGDERNQQLKTDYQQEALSRIQMMQSKDLAYGGNYPVRSIVSSNPSLTGGYETGLNISKT